MTSVDELGAEISRMVARLVPHDGYQLRGLDPLTGAGCLVTQEHSYGNAAYQQLEMDELLGRDLHTIASLADGPSPVGVLGTGSPEERHSVRLHELMAAEGFSGEMRIALKLGGVIWGSLTLMRESGRRPFSDTEVGRAERLSEPLAVAVKQFVTGRGLRPSRCRLAPGIVVVDAADKIRTTATGRDWLRALVPERSRADDDELFGNLWNIVLPARLGGQALTRIPTGNGWIMIHGQLLDGTESGEVVVTLQAAPAEMLLPAVAAWYDITPREQSVIEQVLDGLPAKQIARRLLLSPYTVNDHLKAIYRKTGVGSREELVAGLG